MNKIPKKLLIVILSITGLGLFLLMIYASFWLDLDATYYITFFWVGIIIFLLIYGNRFITQKLDILLPWSKYVGIRYVAQLILGLLYSLIIINITYPLLKNIFTSEPPTIGQIVLVNVYGILLIIPFIAIYFGVLFVRRWQQSEIKGERLEKESIRSQLMALKNHLDPHFLFNNLNILSALIEKDPKLAKEFLDKFSEVYRTLLRSKADELITLQQELQMIDSYLYLLKIRFGEALSFDLQIPAPAHSKYIPPLSLQMLVENCIKHNVVSIDFPLKIQISTDDSEYLNVQNQKKTKNMPTRNTGGTGLENIRNRFAHFTDKPVQIEDTDQIYKVKIPLIELQE